MEGDFKKEIQQSSFWSLTAGETIRILKTDPNNGISEDEAERRLEVFGPNVIESSKGTDVFFIFLNQFKSPLILILLFAVIVTISISHYQDAIFILAAVVINSLLGFYQEYKAEKALAELKTYLKLRTRVIRGGLEYEIDVANLVPGDIIRLAQGDRVPADARLLFVNDLQIEEAILTGESLPVSKQVGPSPADAVIGDQLSMVFTGTLIIQGVGTAVVCRTDLSTELGKIAALVAKSEREETPLQGAIRKFSANAGIILTIFTLAIFGIGVYSGYSPLEMFLTSVAIAVSAVPEGLPIAMTVILAIGVQRMARRKGVIRKLVAAEALGSTTVILTDKTGTLTKAKMELGEILPIAGEEESHLLELALLGTNVLIENKNDNPLDWRMNGHILEKSLVQSAGLRGITLDKVKSKISILNVSFFNAVNKFAASFVQEVGKSMIVFFGAPDIFIGHSDLDPIQQKEMMEKINSLASSGKLVLGVATKEVEHPGDFIFPKDLELSRLNFRGLITLRDPVRPGVKGALARVEEAGIKTVIVTGDHRGTAEAVAREVGMQVVGNSIIDAAELRGLSNADLKKRLTDIRVIARVSPLDKMMIVKAYQDMGEVVAMTGDGVNDSPSIKQADIGIAMGSGTEVARDVADLVLLDDNFETIVAAVEEGRQIMNNIRKVLVYLMSDVADELFLIGGALIAGLPLPLSALQILWVNFFSDSFPAIAFAFEKNIDGFSGGPKSIKNGLFDHLMKFLILFIGLSTSAFLFLIYWLLLRAGYAEDLVRTFIFASFGSYSLFLAFSVRSLEKSIFEYSPFSNPYLVGGTIIGLIMMISGVYVPFMQSLLGTVSLPFYWLVGVVSIGMLNIAGVEFGKFIYRRNYLAI
ncbi:MAG: HAD-IC family P-type ATPase [bacterium]|nr:HAD-IC family P-type ATPase [bacterium]